ncbi:CidA/LrgA family protein [Pseudaeromonas sharmana]|uniref:CidA/LrgA family protein n=1 Tax=Pseudaeromonas sharmana TaxID=328412 RepID=A0ABV8CMF5_9GAMM
MTSLRSLLRISSQIGLLASIFVLAEWAVSYFHLPLPANVTGMLALLGLLLLGWVRVEWFRDGAGWLLAEMLLFFVPAVVAVVNYPDLLLQQGWRIGVVLVLSTCMVLGTTALVVDRLYRFEIWLSRRSRRHA